MKHVTSNTPAVRGETKFPGISRHARLLNISRPHLWQVLTGKRSSRKLLKEYNALLRSEGKPAVTA